MENSLLADDDSQYKNKPPIIDFILTIFQACKPNNIEVFLVFYESNKSAYCQIFTCVNITYSHKPYFFIDILSLFIFFIFQKVKRYQFYLSIFNFYRRYFSDIYRFLFVLFFNKLRDQKRYSIYLSIFIDIQKRIYRFANLGY